jgi:hypothetical protein
MSQKEIYMTFQDQWEIHGDDVSTEFLISITADICGISYETVVDALAAIDKITPYEDKQS